MCALIPAPPGARPQTIELYRGSHALLIGASRYTKGWPDLESVPAEIKTVEELLRIKGFSVKTHLDPDHRELERTFKDFIDNYGYGPG